MSKTTLTCIARIHMTSHARAVNFVMRVAVFGPKATLAYVFVSAISCTPFSSYFHVVVLFVRGTQITGCALEPWGARREKQFDKHEYINDSNHRTVGSMSEAL